MPVNAYRFIDRWRVEGTVEEVADKMRRGEESLKLELLRRRAQSEKEAVAVPMPPQPSIVVRILGLNRKNRGGLPTLLF